ncbi:hypothetical protein J5Y09_17505 [Roseomonas sp. PWR1]|uniref:Uncharacterized protein n=1 Tax=Roseomonas nitratireducens TaxID=2820810 RepID=A0ABS4AWJ1_9PROT|nr:hypothetical protein [Neoroseomonas nitratireducens]MBP0465728.1 hypothetical protein [Neoroseomonas nitratireducens]
MASGQVGWAAAARQVALLALVVGSGIYAWYALFGGPVTVLPWADGPIVSAAPIWLLPAWYLMAWQVLAFASLRRALIGAAVSLGLSLLTFVAALLLGLVSMALLVLPVGLAGVVLIGRDLARRDAADAAPGAGAPRLAHIAGLVVGYAGLLPALLATNDRYGMPYPPAGISAAGIFSLLAPLLLICLPHALLTLTWRAPNGPPRFMPRRAGALLLLIWLPGALALGPFWPALLPSRHAALHAELRLFRDAGGYQVGRYAGEAMRATPGPRPVALTVPEGWLGLEDRNRAPAETPRSIEIVRDPRGPAPGALLRRVRLQARWGLPALTVEPGRVALGCTEPDPAMGGVFACRQLVFEYGEASNPTLAERLPEAALVRRLYTPWAGGADVYHLVGPGLLARCRVEQRCTLVFATREGTEAEVEIPEESAALWREARGEAARLLRDAAGLTLEEAEEVPVTPAR